MGKLIVGTRGSALALAQTDIVCAALRRLHPALDIHVERITTTGDIRADVPLSRLGRGMFVTEIEDALRAGRVDVAVHSAKDLPATLAGDLTIAAFLQRADARDVLVSRFGGVGGLPHGARVGTSSPRRACLLRALRADVEPVDVRGNVDTRLRKLREGHFDALILAAAGLIRLKRESEITEWLDHDTMIPSVGQGALAIEVRAGDSATIQLLSGLDDPATRTAVTAERAFLAELGAGCRAAAGAFGTTADGRLRLTAFIGGPDGRHVRATRTGDAARPRELGSSVARELMRDGGAEFLSRPDSALSNKRVAITRTESQSVELASLLRANGARPAACPTIAIAPVADHSALDVALRDAGDVDWMLFTSANAVDAIADRLAARGTAIPDGVRLGAVGGATAAALSRRIREADFLPSCANAESLAAELPAVAGTTVLFFRGDMAREVLAGQLRRRGVRVLELVVYRTVVSPRASELASLVRAAEVDAVVFTSPSSVRFATGFATAFASAGSPRPAIVCIGPTTSRAVRDVGFSPDAEAATQTVGGIVEALERALAHRSPAQLAAR